MIRNQTYNKNLGLKEEPLKIYSSQKFPKLFIFGLYDKNVLKILVTI